MKNTVIFSIVNLRCCCCFSAWSKALSDQTSFWADTEEIKNPHTPCYSPLYSHINLHSSTNNILRIIKGIQSIRSMKFQRFAVSRTRLTPDRRHTTCRLINKVTSRHVRTKGNTLRRNQNVALRGTIGSSQCAQLHWMLREATIWAVTRVDARISSVHWAEHLCDGALVQLE